ncbi:DUF427-domain-containing protein [Rickenella mellea]|uniref:DUF427-domain-containing protein n=1 Tax=Rickenella mellea TaxID=50990 RepID=A0A4Y7QE46_9AGAM|nr:DUF427-domain-containing protein [Rickenella mellea]
MALPFTKPTVEIAPKRLRVLFGGKYIVDTRRPRLIWEKPYYPTYFVENPVISKEYLKPSEGTAEEQDASNGTVFDVVVGDKVAKSAAVQYGNDAGHLSGLTKLTFGAMDAWFEEDEQIFVHPKDPYKRVDVLQSSRHVRVAVDGIELANTRKPVLLFETGLPVRTYIPKTDCRMDLLVPSELTTECPYKGVASYYSVNMPESSRLIENIVWWYRSPLPECGGIKGFVAFYDEKVDFWIDDQKQARPQTHWS